MCRLIKFSRDERPEGSGLVSRRIMSLSLNPYPLYYRTAFAFSLILYPHRLRRPHGLLTLAGAIRAYPVSLGRPSREGPLSTPAALFAHDGGVKSPRARCNQGRLASSAFWMAHDAYKSSHVLTAPAKP